jgi:hypothetical protein
MNYHWIDKSLITIKGINLFYIFIPNNIFEYKFQNWFDQILDSIEF